MDENLKVLDELIRTSREYRDVIEDIESYNLSEELMNFTKNINRVIQNISDFIYNKRHDILFFYKIQKEKTIKDTSLCHDANYIFHTYQEYYDGLVDYIKKINEAIMSSSGISKEEYVNIIKKIDSVIEKDSSFLDSFEKKESNIDELIVNVECAIDLIPCLKKYRDNIDILTKIRTHNQDIKILFTKLYINSVVNFAYIMEDLITMSYDKIKYIIEGEKDDYENKPVTVGDPTSEGFKMW